MCLLLAIKEPVACSIFIKPRSYTNASLTSLAPPLFPFHPHAAALVLYPYMYVMQVCSELSELSIRDESSCSFFPIYCLDFVNESLQKSFRIWSKAAKNFLPLVADVQFNSALMSHATRTWQGL
jgi:hypothetical protein